MTIRSDEINHGKSQILFMVLAIPSLVMLPLYWLISKSILYNSGTFMHIHPLDMHIKYLAYMHQFCGHIYIWHIFGNNVK